MKAFPQTILFSKRGKCIAFLVVLAFLALLDGVFAVSQNAVTRWLLVGVGMASLVLIVLIARGKHWVP